MRTYCHFVDSGRIWRLEAKLRRRAGKTSTKQDAPNRASSKECFELLLSSSIRFQQGFVEGGFKVAATLTVFLGWLLSANSAQAFIKGAPTKLWLFCLILGCIGTFTVLIGIFQARKEADEVYGKLCAVDYVDESLLTQYRLKPRIFWSVALLNGNICLLLLLGMVVVRVTP